MLVPHQEVAAPNADGAQPMEGTTTALLSRLLLCFILIYAVVRQCAALGM